MSDSRQGGDRSVTVKGGASVGVISTGDYSVVQVKGINMGALANAEDDDRAKLEALVAQLNGLLGAVPPEKRDEAAAVAAYTERLIEDAGAEKPNKPMLQITAKGMKEAAQAVAGVVPGAVKVVESIADLVSRLIS